MMNETSLISIIVPVYNVEPFIREAVESVLRQTYHHFELILIDDGSTDGSGEILDAYASNDGRVQVFHTENRGVSAARNLGLDQARGEWIFFLDGDDRLEDFALETLISYSEGMDMVKGEYDGATWTTYPCNELTVFSMDRLSEPEMAMLYRNELAVTVWNRLYRAECLRIRFDEEMRICEDTMFNLRLIPFLKRVCLVPDITYHYQMREGSAVHTFRGDLFQNVRKLFMVECEVYRHCPAAIAGRSRVYARIFFQHLMFLKRRSSGFREIWDALAEAWIQDTENERAAVRTELFEDELLEFWQRVLLVDLDGIWAMILAKEARNAERLIK